VSFEITDCTDRNAGIASSGLGYLDDSDPNARHFGEALGGPDSGGSLVLVSVSLTPQ